MKSELTYRERVDWFITNYFETGMEYENIYDYLRDKDLDNLDWYGDTVKIPKYKNNEIN